MEERISHWKAPKLYPDCAGYDDKDGIRHYVSMIMRVFLGRELHGTARIKREEMNDMAELVKGGVQETIEGNWDAIKNEQLALLMNEPAVVEAVRRLGMREMGQEPAKDAILNDIAPRIVCSE